MTNEQKLEKAKQARRRVLSVDIEGFRDLWEMVVRTNNSNIKKSHEQNEMLASKLDEISEVLKRMEEKL